MDNDVTKKEKAVVVGVKTNKTDCFEDTMQELCRLAEALDLYVCGQVVQELLCINTATYVGSGKLIELAEFVKKNEADYVIFADTLSPAQLKNITDVILTTVFDRTGLILEIFKRRARTKEAKIQVEIANLQYMLPRLVGMRASLGRQGGASGSLSNKGQGEKQLELDRRHIEKRISQLKKMITEIEHNKEIQRKKRSKSSLPQVALVGYTNAGKSTLMNCLLEKSVCDDERLVFEKDMLFATLDTSVRRIKMEDNKDFLLSDTVGFVSNLPHTLIKAFKSTLDEVKYANLLLIVADASDESYREQIDITLRTLKELNADKIPKIIVMNKADRIENYPAGYDEYTRKIYISARNQMAVDELVEIIKKQVYADNKIIEMLIPYTEGYKISLLNENAHIISQKYLEEGIKIKADCPDRIIGLLNNDITIYS